MAYGANGKFNFLNSTGGTACTNALFGDPLYGTFKACYIKDIPVAASSNVSVNGSSGPTVVALSSVVQVGIQNGPGNATDWLGLYLSGAPNSAYLGYAYVPSGATSATVPFKMPSTTGTYEFRFFANDGWTLLATSPTLTVGVSTSPAPPPAPPPPPQTAPPPTSTPPPSAGTCPANAFYVSVSGIDSQAGTQAAPWRTIGKAAATLRAGQTACVMNGTYEEGMIRFDSSGTATAPITVMAQNPQQAIVSSTSGCSSAIEMFGSYVTIEGLRVAVSPNNVACGYYTSRNAAINAWESNFPSPGNSSSGTVGVVIRGIHVDASNAGSRDVGIKIWQDNAIVENSTLHAGLETLGANAVIFRNNTVYDDCRVSGCMGINAKGGSRNTQVYNNVVHITSSQTGGGIVLGGWTNIHFDPNQPYEAYNAVAYNNVVVNDTGSSRGLYGLVSTRNTVVLNNIGIGGHLFQETSTLANSGATFQNNIMQCNGGSAVGNWGAATVDSNNFYLCSGIPAQSRPISGDPKFVDPASDWHLQTGSPALGSGIQVDVFGFNGEVIDVWRNRDGTVRTAPWNLGIY